MKHVEEQLFENDLQFGKYKMEIKERVQIRIEMDDEIEDQVNRWIADEKIKFVIAINDVEINSVKKDDS